MGFSSSEFLPAALMARITDVRVSDPGFALQVAQARSRRSRLTMDGKLNILAADHPARGVTKVGGDRTAMAVRQDYLGRILRVLQHPGVDGLMATMDVLEDLLIIEGLVRGAGRPPLLDGKVLIGSLNRGGLAGSAWELDDPITGVTPVACARWKLDGTKILLRIALDDPSSLKTMLATVNAINQANALNLPTFLEPLPVVRTEKGWTVQKDWESLTVITGVASALGDSSSNLWLKLPYCEGYQKVAAATTLPILLLGGESAGDPAPFLSEMTKALATGPNVRGALVGRNVLYPGDEDPYAMAAAVGGIIHEHWNMDQAVASLAANRGKDLNRLLPAM